MDSFEWNKIIGAILGTLVFVMGVGFVAEALYHPIEDNGVGYALPMPEAGAAGAAAVEEEVTPLPVLLASASAEDGAAVARKCASCHNFGAGEPNKTGPGLFGIIGHPIAGHEGFAYSDALLEKAAEDGQWTYESLNAFLESPRGYAPGTKMTFAGLRSEQDRADILAYLQTLSDNPMPFPEMAEAPAEDAAMDAEAEGAAEDAGTQQDDAPQMTGAPTTEIEEEAAEPGEAQPGEETQAPVTETTEGEDPASGTIPPIEEQTSGEPRATEPQVAPEIDNAVPAEDDMDGNVEGYNPEADENETPIRPLPEGGGTNP